jgi:hypothetical protein
MTRPSGVLRFTPLIAQRFGHGSRLTHDQASDRTHGADVQPVAAVLVRNRHAEGCDTRGLVVAKDFALPTAMTWRFREGVGGFRCA